MTVGVHHKYVAGVEHGDGGLLLDERRPFHDIADPHVVTRKDGNRLKAVVEPNSTLFSLLRKTLTATDFAQFRFGCPRHGGHRVVDDFNYLARRRKTEAGLVGLMEQRPEPFDGFGFEALDRERQFELVVLAEIPHL